jgi:hypothetical protein
VRDAGVYRQLYRHCSESHEPMAPVDRAAWAQARETVHIYGDTRDGARAVWTHLYGMNGKCVRRSFTSHSQIKDDVLNVSLYE